MHCDDVKSLTYIMSEYTIRRDKTEHGEDNLLACKLAFLDWLAAAAEGQSEESVKRVKQFVAQMGGNRTCTVIGENDKASPLWATMINSTASHSQDFDDIHSYLSMHLETPVISAALASAECENASGHDFLTAVIKGMQIMAALGDAVLPEHASRGWLATATLGIFGAAAASGYLMRLTNLEMCRAYGLAASCAAGTQYSLGYMSKIYQTAHAARQGLEAAMLAKMEFTAAEKVFDTHYLEMLATTVNREAALQRLTGTAAVQEMYFKPFPCGAPTHPGIVNCSRIMSKNDLKVDDIISINLTTYPRAYKLAGNPSPETPMQGKYSIPFCAVAGLCYGKVDSETFVPEIINDPVVKSLLKKTTLKPDENMIPTRGGRAEICYTDGRVFTHETHPFGKSVRSVNQYQQVIDKYDLYVCKAYGKDRTEKIFETVMKLEKTPDITDHLVQLLRK